jgi:hypothetical protein
MTKRLAATSDNGFISKENKLKLKYKREMRKKSCEPFWRAALTKVWPI